MTLYLGVLSKTRKFASVVTYFGATLRVIQSFMVPRDIVLSPEKPNKVADKGVI